MFLRCTAQVGSLSLQAQSQSFHSCWSCVCRVPLIRITLWTCVTCRMRCDNGLLEQTCQKSTATATAGLQKKKVCSILMPRFMSRKARISTLHFRLIFFDSLIGQGGGGIFFLSGTQNNAPWIHMEEQSTCQLLCAKCNNWTCICTLARYVAGLVFWKISCCSFQVASHHQDGFQSSQLEILGHAIIKASQ